MRGTASGIKPENSFSVLSPLSPTVARCARHSHPSPPEEKAASRKKSRLRRRKTAPVGVGVGGCVGEGIVGRAQNIESTENIRVFGGFLRAKGVFLEKNDGDRVVFPVFEKTLFVWKLFELGASEGLLEAVWAFLRRLRFEVCFSRVFTGFWCRFS